MKPKFNVFRRQSKIRLVGLTTSNTIYEIFLVHQSIVQIQQYSIISFVECNIINMVLN